MVPLKKLHNIHKFEEQNYSLYYNPNNLGQVSDTYEDQSKRMEDEIKRKEILLPRQLLPKQPLNLKIKKKTYTHKSKNAIINTRLIQEPHFKIITVLHIHLCRY